MTIAEQIAEKSRVRFRRRPSNAREIDSLRSLGLPEDAIAFYRDFTPERIAEIGKVRLLAASYVPSENSDGIVPGSFAYPCGYVCFATTIYGDAYCFDTKSAGFPSTASVVLIAHDLEPENDEMERDDLAELAKPIAPSFENFLQAFVSETLDIEPLYPPFDSGKSETFDS